MPTSDDDAYSFLMQMNSAPAFAAGEWFQLGIADRESDLLIGDIGVRVSGDGLEAEIGFTLSRDSQGQGLAREAVELAFEILFATTEVGRIFAVTDARNTGANALLLSLGLGRMESRNAIFRNEPCIEHTYALKRGGVT